MLRIVLLVLALFAVPVAAQSFILEETLSGGGQDNDSGQGVALAPNGDRYVSGTFEGVASFGTVTITSLGGKDFFLVKYSPQGDVVWARRGGTNGANDHGAAVAVAPDGSIYATGTFSGNATFDGGTNPDILLIAFGDFDAFLAKYDSNGNVQWVRQAGGVDQDRGHHLAVDTEGSIYLAGSFSGTGTFSGETLMSAGGTDAFLAKYAPDGTVVWVRRGGSSQDDAAFGVAVDDSGAAHLSGSFEGTAQFGSLSLQSAGGSDVFVVQHTPSGEPAWATRIGGQGDDFTRGGGIGLKPNGTVFVHGAFASTVTIGEDVLTSASPSDIFLAKLNPEGEALWGRRGGGDVGNAPGALSVFGEGILLTGYVEGTGTFADTPITTQGRDAFFAVFDVTGNLFTVKMLGGPGQDAGTFVASDLSTSRFAVVGFFEDTADFDGQMLTSAGDRDAYVVGGRFGVVALELGLGAPNQNGLGAAYPNPFSKQTTLTLEVAEAQTVTVEVFDLLGRRMSTIHDGLLSVGVHRILVEAAGLPTGFYFVRAGGETFQFARRVTLTR